MTLDLLWLKSWSLPDLCGNMGYQAHCYRTSSPCMNAVRAVFAFLQHTLEFFCSSVRSSWDVDQLMEDEGQGVHVSLGLLWDAFTSPQWVAPIACPENIIAMQYFQFSPLPRMLIEPVLLLLATQRQNNTHTNIFFFFFFCFYNLSTELQGATHAQWSWVEQVVFKGW